MSVKKWAVDLWQGFGMGRRFERQNKAPFSYEKLSAETKSKMEAILQENRYENEAIGVLNDIVDIDMFVISQPKCATSVLQRGFENIGRKAIHAHSNHTTYPVFPEMDQCISLEYLIRHRLEENDDPIYIFCGYRELVSWYLSVAGHFNAALDEKLREDIADNFANRYPWNDYFVEDTYSVIEGVFGIDLLSYDFDLERGYSVITAGNVNIIMYRFDKLENLAAYIVNHVDDRFSVRSERVNEDENYIKHQQEFRLDREVLESLYDNKYTKKFFSQREIEGLIEKYTAPL